MFDTIYIAMTRNFKPNPFIIRGKRVEKKLKTSKPTPPKTIHIFQYYKIMAHPHTKIRYFTVNPGEKLDLYVVREKLNEYFPCTVDLRYVMLTNWFDVILDTALPWGEVCEKTLKAMGEIID